MTEVVTMLIDEAQQDPDVHLEYAGLALKGRLAQYAVLPNLGPEPEDCLMFANVVR